MDNLNVSSAQYVQDTLLSVNTCVKAVVDGETIFVPLDPSNRHYAEIMRQVEAGTLTIQNAEET
jgi:hypothetical protein